MALAEFVNWWGVILLPLTVAVFVKINDLVAGLFSRPDLYRRGRTTVLRPVIWARGVASVPTAAGTQEDELGAPSIAEWVPPRAPSAMYGVSLARRNDDASVGVPVITRPANRRHATNQRRFITATALRQPARRHAPSRDSIKLSGDGIKPSRARYEGRRNGMKQGVGACGSNALFPSTGLSAWRSRAGRDQASAASAC